MVLCHREYRGCSLGLGKPECCDVAHIVSYWSQGPEFFTPLGIDATKISPVEKRQAHFSRLFGNVEDDRSKTFVILLLNDSRVGYMYCSDEKENTPGLHIHLWSPAARGQGFGSQFFLLGVRYFSELLETSRFHVEVATANDRMATMLTKLGLRPSEQFYRNANGYLLGTNVLRYDVEAQPQL